MMRRWSIATRLFVSQLVVILVLTGAAVLASWADARADVERDAAARSLAVAETIAHDPFVVEGVTSPDPTATLQPYAVEIMDSAAIDFITIMSPERIRYTHRDPDEIGKQFLGTIDRALAGESFTETYTGTLGPSVRAVVPIEDAGGSVVALVSAGITVSNTQVALGGRIATVLLAAAAALALGALASWGVSRYLRRVTWGRGAEEMSRMFAYYEGVLHSISEGLVLQDASRRVVLYNDRAAELLGLPRSSGGAPVAVSQLPLDAPVAAALDSAEVAVDEIVVTDTHVLVLDRDRVVSSPESGRARGRAHLIGTVTTLRDHTRLQELAGELDTMTTLSDALRSQTHEFANRLHTITALIELGRAREAAELASSQLAVSQQLADRILTALDEPVLLALLLGKAAQAAERGVALELAIPDRVDVGGLPPHELITIVGNLVDNALDAVAGTEHPVVEVAIGADARGAFRIEVSDSGPGPGERLADSVFGLGVTTKTGEGHGIGLALVRQAAKRLGGDVTVEGSRFTVTVPVPAEAGR
ncbi:GHKL domain-containing protein [Herbiconiux sp. SALV-R1]|nr:GHKL domain-containing protein [Herbiconiux sp. SALV-R1]